MNARKLVIATLAILVAANAFVVLDALTLGLVVPLAVAEPGSKGSEGPRTGGPSSIFGDAATEPMLHDDGPQQAAETYRGLVAALTQQREALDRRELELQERERQIAILKTQLLAESEKSRQAAAQTAANGAPAIAAFDKLLKAYEGMDPANASAAMAELYARDRKVVVDLLLGLKARQSGAIMDSLAQTSPTIAADLSLDVWKRDREEALAAD